MQPVKIDIVGAQPLQASFQRLRHVLALVAAVGVILARRQRLFGGNHKMIAV